ncbi:MAG: DCC1-like thiol-disulfide oxidoreductase family protein, partial [Candidatus Neomarinimicrobiota bacterium]|nr:DCC1-like thiol-disulfide oxidoreductase family protein [Candidatus Neomarinimicrobiota bacterium]
MTASNKKRFQPKHPVMIWDRDCQFCKLYAGRFKALALDNIEFIPYQDLAAKYPKAPDLDYKKSVVFFTHNNTYTGAAAVFSYYSKIGRKLPMWLYRRFKLFARISEISYRYITNHRRMFRLICQTFWGANLVPDTYKTSGWIFGRLLGLVGIIAFLSLWVQSDMLISSRGIVPFQSDLGQVEGFITTTGTDISKWLARPTILWFSKTDLWLNIVLCFGTFSSTLLLLGIVPHLAIAIS